MTSTQTLLVLGATGQTGKHFTRLALDAGHRVRALARTPGKLAATHDALEVVQGSVTDTLDLDALLDGVDGVVVMLGDVVAQRDRLVNTEFVRRLVPAMRRRGVRRLLYQAGGLSAAPGKRLVPVPRLVRATIARSYDGQHRDNRATALVAAGVSVLMLTACSAPGSAHPSVSSSPGQIQVAGHSRHAFPLITGSSAGLTTVRWDKVASEGDTLVIAASKHGCSTPIGATVHESGARLRVVVYAQKAQEPCTAEGLDLVGYIKTSRPVAELTIQQ